MSRFKTLTPASLSREAFVEAFADIYEHSPGSPRRPMTWVSTTASTISRACTSAWPTFSCRQAAKPSCR